MSLLSPVIAIDYGTHKSGLAYSVEGFCFAYKTIATSALFEFLPVWIEEKRAEKIIIGMPYNIDGSESSHSKKVRKFAKELEKHTEKEILFHDERLTTSEARLAGVSDIDAESARLILEDYLKQYEK